MDELANQLKQLGTATEASVEPVTSAEAIEQAEAAATMMDIGLPDEAGRAGASSSDPSRRKLSPRVLLGAAAVLAIMVGSIAFLGRTDGDQVDLASAIRQDQTFTVPDSDNGWHALRECESSNIYDIDTGNTFYGAYQFTRESFRETATTLRLTAYVDSNPADVPPHIQDAVANALYLEQGVDPWPVCGQYIEGPMITPVVPQWLRYSTEVPEVVSVFIDPAASPERIAEIGLEVADVAAVIDESHIRFVDQQAAYDQYVQGFTWNPLEVDAVRIEHMPARYEILARLNQSRFDKLRALDDVFTVSVSRQSDGRPSGQMRLSIPSIGLETPVYNSPTNDGFASAAALMVDSPDGLVIAGFGSEQGSVFERINELAEGDTVLVTTLVLDAGFSWEFVRTYRIDRRSDALPVYDLDDMLLWQTAESPGLTLVADVDGEPTQRLLLRARATSPELAGYPVASNE